MSRHCQKRIINLKTLKLIWKNLQLIVQGIQSALSSGSRGKSQYLMKANRILYEE